MLACHFVEILVEVGRVSLDEYRVDLAPPLLVEEALLKLLEILEYTFCVV